MLSSKKYSSECFLEMNESNISSSKKNKAFTEILQEIRDMKVLSNYQLYNLRQTSRISRANLLEIIELYNFVICNVNGGFGWSIITTMNSGIIFPRQIELKHYYLDFFIFKRTNLSSS